MAEDTIDLSNYLLLEPDATAVLLPGGGDFLESVDVRRCDRFRHSQADEQREGGGSLVGVVNWR